MNDPTKVFAGRLMKLRSGSIEFLDVWIDAALAAGSRRAKTPKAVECEASQSGDAEQRNAPKGSERLSQ